MLGWYFVVFPDHLRGHMGTFDEDQYLARWEVGGGGTAWIEKLCREGRAKSLGGNGYPMSYAIDAGTLVLVLSRGIPTEADPLVIGEDYVTPSGWSKVLELKLSRMRALPPDTPLAVEAWDQS